MVCQLLRATLQHGLDWGEAQALAAVTLLRLPGIARSIAGREAVEAALRELWVRSGCSSEGGEETGDIVRQQLGQAMEGDLMLSLHPEGPVVLDLLEAWREATCREEAATYGLTVARCFALTGPCSQLEAAQDDRPTQPPPSGAKRPRGRPVKTPNGQHQEVSSSGAAAPVAPPRQRTSRAKSSAEGRFQKPKDAESRGAPSKVTSPVLLRSSLLPGLSRDERRAELVKLGIRDLRLRARYAGVPAHRLTTPRTKQDVLEATLDAMQSFAASRGPPAVKARARPKGSGRKPRGEEKPKMLT